MRKQIFLVLYLLEICFFANAQDSHFSQYEYSPLTINPALTGIDKKLQVALHHKDQWRGLNGFRTDELSFEIRFDPSSWIKIKNRTAQFQEGKEQGFAFGLNIFNDKAGDGDMQKISGNSSLAYHLPINENSKISAGLLGGIEQRSINQSGLRFNSQYDANGIYDPAGSSGETYVPNKLINGDLSAGLCYTFGKEDEKKTDNDNKLFKAGVSLNHIYTQEKAFTTNPNSKNYFKYTLHAQSLFGIKNSNYSIKTSIISMFQGKQNEITFGIIVKYKMKEVSKYTGIRQGMALSFGSFYKFKDAIIPYIQYEVARGAIGLSYDINSSPLRNATIGRGGIELTLRFFNPLSFLYQNKK